jgi:hypothetical protein
MQRVIFALAACELAFAFAVRAIPYCMLEHPLQLLNTGFLGGEGGLQFALRNALWIIAWLPAAVAYFYLHDFGCSLVMMERFPLPASGSLSDS